MTKEATSLFLEQFGGVGSPSLECCCGREHHAIDSDYIDEAEAKDLRSTAERLPKHHILHHDVDGVSAKHIGGHTVVADCPCETMAKLEEIIWAERAAIVGYYQQRRRQDAENLKGLDDVSPKEPA